MQALLLRQLRKIGSDVIDVHPMIINLLVQEGNLDEAATEINHRAEKMIEEGQYAEAEQEIRRGIDMAPKALDLRLSAVKAAARQELTSEKLDLCVEDIDVLLDHSMFTMAVKALEILYQQQPDNEMIVALLISTCQSLNDKDKVIDYQVRMAEIHRANDNLPEAILLLEELVKANRKSIRLLSRMSDFLIEADAVKEAKVALGRLARLQIDKDDKEGAAGTLEKLAEIDPAHLDAREAEINLLLQLGHEEKVNERACAFAEILEEESSGQGQHFAALIRKSAMSLQDTLTAVLTLSRLEADRMDFDIGVVDVQTAARYQLEQFAPDAEAASVTLDGDFQQGCVEADRAAIDIILRNLISNAIKYTPEGGRVTVRTLCRGDQAGIEVEDTGIGMDKDRVSDLIQPFRQASEGFDREYEGVGLGLTLVHRATHALGGGGEIGRARGEGTTVGVWFRRTEEPASEREQVT